MASIESCDGRSVSVQFSVTVEPFPALTSEGSFSCPRRVATVATKPFFCIGGIKNDNAGQVLAAGGRRIVVVSGILQAPDVAAYCRALKALLAACC